MYNLVGGKIEEGETSEQAALRELSEETGMKGYEVRQLGVMTNNWNPEDMNWLIDVMEVKCIEKVALQTEGEKPDWFSNHRWPLLPIIPNLRVIIPLCQSGLAGWTFVEDNIYRYEIIWNP